MPMPSRSRPMSSMATHQLRPANDTVSARRAARSPSSQPPTSAPPARAATSSSVSGPSSRSRSATPSASRAARSAERCCSWRPVRGDDLGIEQFAQLDAAQQLGQQRAVQRERGGPPLGQRAVALVHERADVAEQQRGGERRRRRAVSTSSTRTRRCAMPVISSRQGRDVVDVLQAFADGLQHDREVGILAGHVEQLGGALALLPQRRAAPGVPARQQQGAGRAFAEPRREQRRAAHLGGDDRVDLVGVEDEQFGAGRVCSRIRSVSGRRTTMPSSEAVGFSSMP